ncbi:MAG: hypothetical protein R3C56_13045 [Pirellulaceae bacterium]
MTNWLDLNGVIDCRADRELLTATGFLRMAADGTGSGDNSPEARNKVIADSMKIIGTTLLGSSLHCAMPRPPLRSNLARRLHSHTIGLRASLGLAAVARANGAIDLACHRGGAAAGGAGRNGYRRLPSGGRRNKTNIWPRRSDRN